jgi:hypothetical protein
MVKISPKLKNFNRCLRFNTQTDNEPQAAFASLRAPPIFS